MFRTMIHHTKKTISVDEIMAMEPCWAYPRKDVTKLFSGRKRLNVKQLLDLKLPNCDIIWLLLHFFDTDMLKKIGYASLRALGETRPKKIWNNSVRNQMFLADRMWEVRSESDKAELRRLAFFWEVFGLFEEFEYGSPESNVILDHNNLKNLMKVLQRYLKKVGLLT